MKRMLSLLTALQLSAAGWSQPISCPQPFDPNSSQTGQYFLDPNSQAMLWQILYFASQWMENDSTSYTFDEVDYEPEWQTPNPDYPVQSQPPFDYPAPSPPAQGWERGGPPTDGRDYSNSASYGILRKRYR